MKRTSWNKLKRKKGKDSRILRPKRSTLDSLKLRKRKELMKWRIVREDKESLWTWWLRPSSRITKINKKKRIKESSPSISPENRLRWSMNKAERKDFINKKLSPRTTSYNRLKTKSSDNRRRNEETRSKLRSGRKKPVNTSILRKRSQITSAP